MSAWERRLRSFLHECCTRASSWEQPNEVTRGGSRHQGRGKTILKSSPVNLLIRQWQFLFCPPCWAMTVPQAKGSRKEGGRRGTWFFDLEEQTRGGMCREEPWWADGCPCVHELKQPKTRGRDGFSTSFKGNVFWIHIDSKIIFNSISNQFTEQGRDRTWNEILIYIYSNLKKKLTGKIKFQVFFIQRFSKEIKQKKANNLIKCTVQKCLLAFNNKS